MRSGSLVRRWPSCQIQWVSMAVTARVPLRRVGDHRQRNVEMIVRMRAPGETEHLAKLGYAHRALHGPKMGIGERMSTDWSWIEWAICRQSVAIMLVAVGMPVARRNSARTSRPE